MSLEREAESVSINCWQCKLKVICELILVLVVGLVLTGGWICDLRSLVMTVHKVKGAAVGLFCHLASDFEGKSR